MIGEETTGNGKIKKKSVTYVDIYFLVLPSLFRKQLLNDGKKISTENGDDGVNYSTKSVLIV
jgi:hypothetical protein